MESRSDEAFESTNDDDTGGVWFELQTKSMVRNGYDDVSTWELESDFQS